jgi:hypothetical protein
MNNIEMRIRFPEVGNAAELEIVAPASSDTEARIWGALDTVPARRGEPYLVNTGARLIASVGLTEHNGARLSPKRAGEVLEALRVTLAPRASMRALPCRTHAAEPTRWTRTGAYPRAELSSSGQPAGGGPLPAVA